MKKVNCWNCQAWDRFYKANGKKLSKNYGICMLKAPNKLPLPADFYTTNGDKFLGFTQIYSFMNIHSRRRKDDYCFEGVELYSPRIENYRNKEWSRHLLHKKFSHKKSWSNA